MYRVILATKTLLGLRKHFYSAILHTFPHTHLIINGCNWVEILIYLHLDA